MNNFPVNFFTNHEKYAYRELAIIPRKGDELHFRSGEAKFIVRNVVWKFHEAATVINVYMSKKKELKDA